MARIRTIKPDFFTSEDIVSLSPLARLLYVAIWCEADKEGRLVWKPMTLKFRYFPGDACDISALCEEVLSAGLVVLYGDGYARIPTFKAHQHINPRESASQLPGPDAPLTREPRVGARAARDDDAQGGREGKGKEEEGSRAAPSKNGTRLSEEWAVPIEWHQWAELERPDLHVQTVASQFRDYWIAKPGKDGRKLNWSATWRNWVRNQRSTGHAATAAAERTVNFV